MRATSSPARSSADKQCALATARLPPPAPGGPERTGSSIRAPLYRAASAAPARAVVGAATAACQLRATAEAKASLTSWRPSQRAHRDHRGHPRGPRHHRSRRPSQGHRSSTAQLSVQPVAQPLVAQWWWSGRQLQPLLRWTATLAPAALDAIRDRQESRRKWASPGRPP